MGAKIVGAKELRRTLKQAGVDMNDPKDVMASIANLVVGEASRKAPRRTGALAASGRGNRALARAQIIFGGARLRYAGPIHWGWPARGIRARPFASDAAKATEPQWTELYLQGVQKIIATIRGA